MDFDGQTPGRNLNYSSSRGEVRGDTLVFDVSRGDVTAMEFEPLGESHLQMHWVTTEQHEQDTWNLERL